MTVPWRVLLIAGCAGTGKSTAAQALGRRLGHSMLLVDDIRIALQAITTAQEHPALQTFLSEGSPAYASPAAFCQGLFSVARALAPALRVIVTHHLAVAEAGPVIIEGDGILPDLVAGIGDPRCRAVLLHTSQAGSVLRTLQARGGGFTAMPAERRALIAEGSWQYGAALAARAAAVNVPLLEPMPFTSLPDRILSHTGPPEAPMPVPASAR
jgi:2-phosphoglycerate kinase